MTTQTKPQDGDLSTPKLDLVEGPGFRVVRLTGSNVKRVRAVDITPDPTSPLVVIAGNNGEGKTSAMDLIWYTLGGKDAVCADPIRHGQTKAFSEVDLGDYIANRRYTPTGQTITVKTKEGLNVPAPQTFLDGLRGRLNFDPLAFSRMNAKARFETLRELVHLDIDLPALEAQRKTLYDARTDLSRRHRDFEGQLRQTPEPDADLPVQKIDVAALMGQKNALEARKAANQRERIAADTALRLKERYAQELHELMESELAMVRRHADELAALQRRHQGEATAMETAIIEKRELVAGQFRIADQCEKDCAALIDPDTTEIDAKIAEASDLNTKIDRAMDYRARRVQLRDLAGSVNLKTSEIEDLDRKKSEALAAARFPIDGLSFADGDVSYNAVLFDQLSSAEQVRVSLAMAMAMNPKLRVILIKDGSLLDETSLGIIREMAQERGFQIWLEVVGNRSDATVIIEDGAVVGAEASEPTNEVTTTS